LRASVRGDLILEEGMNVKVCTFPGRSSFAKKTSHDDLLAYLEEDNAKISLKRH
jgi:DNA primase